MNGGRQGCVEYGRIKIVAGDNRPPFRNGLVRIEIIRRMRRRRRATRTMHQYRVGRFYAYGDGLELWR